MNIKLMLGGTSVLSLAAGIGVGYVLTKKSLGQVYADMIEQEVAEAKAHYSDKADHQIALVKSEYNELFKSASTKIVTEHLVEPEELVPDRVIQVLRNYQGVQPSEAALEEVPTVLNTLVPAPSQPAKPKMVPLQSDIPGEPPGEIAPPAPYIITFEEYDNAEVGYEQRTVTYFSGDGVVTDEEDKPMTQVLTTLGFDNLKDDKFAGSNVIFVRSEKLKLDFEVIRSEGMYSEEVLNEPAP